MMSCSAGDAMFLVWAGGIVGIGIYYLTLKFWS